jgi:hypothetical protein
MLLIGIAGPRLHPPSALVAFGGWPASADRLTVALVIATPAIVSYASSLAGRPVAVVCNRDQSFDPGTLGYTLYDARGVVYPAIYLPASTCRRLNELAGPARPKLVDRRSGRVLGAVVRRSVDLPDGSAVDTLIHETTHILEQSTNEARVECDSYRNRWSALKLFRLAAKQASGIMRGMTAAHLASPASYLKNC